MTKRTPQLTSFRQLAGAIGRSPAVALEWTRHPEWPYARQAPWNAADADAMVAWADEHLRRDKEEDVERIAKRERVGATSGFWSMFDPKGGTPHDVADHGFGDACLSDPAIVMPLEAAIMRGDPLPADDAVREMIRLGVLTRARMMATPSYAPGWLRGQTPGEAADRLAAIVHETTDYVRWRIGELSKPTRRKAAR